MNTQIKQKNGYNYPKAGVIKTILWVLLPLALFYLLQLIVSAIVVLFTGDSSLSWEEQTKVVEKFSNENALLLSLIVFGTSLVILLPIWLKQRRYLPTVKKSAGAKTIVTGLIFALGVTFAVGLLNIPLTDVMQSIIPDGGYGAVSSVLLSGGNTFMQIIAVIIVGPIAEEVIFRGLVLNRLMSKMPVWGAVVISGLLFGIYHMNSVQSIIATFMGIAIAILYVKTRSLTVCMVFHIINNGISLLQARLSVNFGSNEDMFNTIILWISIAIIVIAIIPSVIFFKSKGAEVKTVE